MHSHYLLRRYQIPITVLYKIQLLHLLQGPIRVHESTSSRNVISSETKKRIIYDNKPENKFESTKVLYLNNQNDHQTNN